MDLTILNAQHFHPRYCTFTGVGDAGDNIVSIHNIIAGQIGGILKCLRVSHTQQICRNFLVVTRGRSSTYVFYTIDESSPSRWTLRGEEKILGIPQSLQSGQLNPYGWNNEKFQRANTYHWPLHSKRSSYDFLCSRVLLTFEYEVCRARIFFFLPTSSFLIIVVLVHIVSQP